MRYGVEKVLIDIAPSPILTGFVGSYDWMPRGMEMSTGMFVFGAVATADVAASEALAQMHPGVAGLEALFTAIGGAGRDAADLLDMGAGGHRGSLAGIGSGCEKPRHDDSGPALAADHMVN